MGAYVDSLLTGDERVIFETKISWVEYVAYGGVILIFALCLWFAAMQGMLPYLYAVGLIILFAIAIGIVPWLKRRCSEFVVTSRRVVMKTGIISRNVFEMRLQKIESVDLSQSVWGRLLNYGTVVVHGTGDTARSFSMIADPVHFRHVIDQACEAARNSARE